MPAKWIIDRGLSEYWTRAKTQAEKQGQKGNYAYAMSIFKEMTKNKSMDEEIDMKKAFTIPPQFRHHRIPGQVPDPDRLAANRLMAQKPQGITVARLLQPTQALSSRGVISDLGFDVAKSQDWEKFLDTTVNGASNEIVLRKEVLSKCQESGMDSGLRRVILQRSLGYWRGLRKSRVEIVSVDGLLKKDIENEAVGEQIYTLKKAQSPGGTYHRRVPKKSGKGFTYYYDEEKYRNSKRAHASGEETEKAYISDKVCKAVEAAGGKGCPIKEFGPLVKRYGAKKVGSVMTAGRDKHFTYKSGKFFPYQDPKEQKAQKEPKAKLVMSEKQLTSRQKGVSSKDVKRTPVPKEKGK